MYYRHEAEWVAGITSRQIMGTITTVVRSYTVVNLISIQRNVLKYIISRAKDRNSYIFRKMYQKSGPWDE